MINGRQVIAIIRADNPEQLSSIEALRASRYIGLRVVVSTEADVVQIATDDGIPAHLVPRQPLVEITDNDFVRAIVESDEEDAFIDGDPYLVYLNLGQCTSSVQQIDGALQSLDAMADDHTLFAPGLGLGRQTAFRIFGQFDGPNASAL